MSWLRMTGRKVVGLFVDDPVLAAGVTLWIILIALLGAAAPGQGAVHAYVLALGLCAILTLSIVRGGTKSS